MSQTWNIFHNVCVQWTFDESNAAILQFVSANIAVKSLLARQKSSTRLVVLFPFVPLFDGCSKYTGLPSTISRLLFCTSIIIFGFSVPFSVNCRTKHLLSYSEHFQSNAELSIHTKYMPKMANFRDSQICFT